MGEQMVLVTEGTRSKRHRPRSRDLISDEEVAVTRAADVYWRMDHPDSRDGALDATLFAVSTAAIETDRLSRVWGGARADAHLIAGTGVDSRRADHYYLPEELYTDRTLVRSLMRGVRMHHRLPQAIGYFTAMPDLGERMRSMDAEERDRIVDANPGIAHKLISMAGLLLGNDQHLVLDVNVARTLDRRFGFPIPDQYTRAESSATAGGNRKQICRDDYLRIEDMAREFFADDPRFDMRTGTVFLYTYSRNPETFRLSGKELERKEWNVPFGPNGMPSPRRPAVAFSRTEYPAPKTDAYDPLQQAFF